MSRKKDIRKGDKINKDNFYIEIAKTVSYRSHCTRAKVGAVLVKDDTILSAGYNGLPRGSINCDEQNFCLRKNDESHVNRDACNVIHAELNCILSAARNGIKVSNSTIYIYFNRVDNHDYDYYKPCDKCLAILKNAGIKDFVMFIKGEVIKGDI